MVAIQGPQAVRILPPAVERFDASWETMKYYSIAAAHIGGKVARIARTGYTGEDGFEVYLEAGDASALWRRLLEIGGNRLSPIGLGARDTLRLEAAMPLYGNELDEETDPFEAGLDFAVKLEKPLPFIGRESLLAKREKGPSRRLTGFRLLGRRVARSGMTIHAPAEKGAEAPVGRITSGAPSPTLGVPIALGYLSASVGEMARASLTVDVRGNREPAQIEALPFFSRTRKKDT
jgi:aminomethyltransferase